MVIREISKEVYLSDPKYLREGDADALMGLVDILSSGLAEQGLDVAILAVGTSTFSQYYWKRQAELSVEHPELNLPDRYDDIDIRVVPEKEIGVATLRKKIGALLDGIGYKWIAQKDTPMGRSGPRDIGQNKKVDWTCMGYNVHSITTTLSNKTSLDIILGPDASGNLDIASDKLRWEREEKNENRPFVLLYRK